MLNFFSSISQNDQQQEPKAYLLTLHGQSNMVGSGGLSSEVQTNYPSYYGLQDDSFVFNNGLNQFQQLNVGLNSNVNNEVLAGPEVSLIKDIRNHTSAKIHYVKYAVGATSLPTRWSVSIVGDLYDEYISQVDKAITLMNNTYGVGNWKYLANIWHQGESDSFDVPGNYEQEEFDFISAIRQQYGNAVIWISGGVRPKQNEGETDISNIVNIRKQANAAKSDLNFWFDNSDLTLSDPSHYDTDSQILHGKRYVNILKDYI